MFRFYSGDRGEPPHVHVRRDRNTAKIWLQDMSVEYSYLSGKEMKRVMRIVERERLEMMRQWNDFFS